MSYQHAQAAICDFYSFDGPRWSTPSSSYARAYYEWRVGERIRSPRMPRGISGLASDTADEAAAARIRQRIDAELER